MSRPRKKSFQIDPRKDRIFVRDRKTGIAVACFKHGDGKNEGTIACCLAIAHALTLELR